MHQTVVGGIQRHVSHIIFVGENDPGLDVILPLACVLIVLSLVVIRVAFTVITAGSVEAVLRTHFGDLEALVDVSTCLPIIE